MADRIAVMYAGDVIEVGETHEIFFHSKHPYTWALISSLPQLGSKGNNCIPSRAHLRIFSGNKGRCLCPTQSICIENRLYRAATFFQVSDTHYARTWLLDPLAPKVEPPAALQAFFAEGGSMRMTDKEVLVEVKNLKVVFGKGKNKFTAIDDVSFQIYKGETFGIVGESGSGKTTIGRAIMRINEVTEGQILYHGKSIQGKSRKIGIEKLRKNPNDIPGPYGISK